MRATPGALLSLGVLAFSFQLRGYLRPINVIGVGLYLFPSEKQAFLIQAAVFHSISYCRPWLGMSYIFHFPLKLTAYQGNIKEKVPSCAIAVTPKLICV